jgi:hypothetical protein
LLLVFLFAFVQFFCPPSFSFLASYRDIDPSYPTIPRLFHGIPQSANQIFLAIFTTNYTFDRLTALVAYLHSRPHVPSPVFPMVFYPQENATLPPLPFPSLCVPSHADAYIGLCVRETASLEFFVRNTTANWYFRAMDDTWVSPENMVSFVSGLSQAVSPATDIVIKASKTRNERYKCQPWFDGGVGWLLSRAGAQHVLEYNFVNVCRHAPLRHDDISMGLIAYHTFPDHRFWDSPFLPGNPYFRRYWSPPTPSQAPVPNCEAEFVWPVSRVVAIHTQGRPWLQAELANATKMPSDIAYELLPGKWGICRMTRVQVERFEDRSDAKKWTLPLKFAKGDRGMRVSKVPPLGCSQCVDLGQTETQSEEYRIGKWRDSHWSGFPGEWIG